jgi:endoglucanase
VIVTGTSTLTPRTTTITLTVNAPATQNYTLAANPASVSVARGAAVTSVVNLTRTNFTGSVTLSATGLPAGVTAAFSPASTTGNTSTLTLTASGTATLGAATVTVTGTTTTLTPRTTTIALNVTGTTGGTGGVTVTPVVNANSQWFNEEFIRIANTASITALSVTIVIQRTPTGVSFSNIYNTVGGQIQQSNSSTTTAITYTFTLGPGQTLGTGTNWTFAAQASGTGTIHPTVGDTYTVIYTTGGTSFTQSGHF